MLIATTSVDALSRAMLDWQPDAVVTIHRPSMRVMPIDGVPHLRLGFHDVEHGGRAKAQPCTIGHVRAFLAFIERERPRRLLIQCTAGLSRSPAFAIIAQCWAQADAVAACSEVLRCNPHASPNRLVLRLGDVALGTDGAMTKAAAAAFTYRRTAFGPIGPRAGFVILNQTSPQEGQGRPQAVARTLVCHRGARPVLNHPKGKKYLGSFPVPLRTGVTRDPGPSDGNIPENPVTAEVYDER